MMGLFGSSRSRFAAGVVATPEQEEESRRLAQQFGMGTPAAGRPGDQVVVGDDWQNTFPIMQQAPAQPQRWMDGGKFTGKDAFGLALAAIGDVAGMQSGGQATAMPSIIKGMMGNRELQQKAQLAQQQRMQEREDWKWKQDYQAAHPGPAKDDAFTQTLRSAGIDPASPEGQGLYRQRAATMAMPAPSLIGSPDTGYRWAQPPAPSLGGMPAQQAVPTVSDEAGYAALPAGSQYRDPNGNLRTKGGGAGNGAGNFPVPSGNPLNRPW